MAAIARSQGEACVMPHKQETLPEQQSAPRPEGKERQFEFAEAAPTTGAAQITTGIIPSSSFSSAMRYSLLDFPPGISPSPLPTIEQTPNRFLQKCAKLDLEPNPFEFSFSAQQQGSLTEQPNTVGFASSPNPILPPLIPTPRGLDGFSFKTGFTPGPGGLGMLTPLSATLASLGLPINTASTNVHFPDGKAIPDEVRSSASAPHMSPASEPHPSAIAEHPVSSVQAQYAYTPALPAASLVPVHPDNSTVLHEPPPQPMPLQPYPPIQIGHQHQAPHASVYGHSHGARPYGMSSGMDPMVAGPPPSYSPPSPQAAAAALLDMRRDRDYGGQGFGPQAGWSGAGVGAEGPSDMKAPPAGNNKQSRDNEGSSKQHSPPSFTKKRRRAASVISRNGEGEERSKSAGSERESNGYERNEEDMDPEEKRKTFLERNRQAALKCRQKKKQWLQSLQEKVDVLTSDNESLQTQATQLREEILNLKTLLLAHRDCPVAKQNGLNLVAIESSLPITSIQSYSHRMY